MATREVTIDLQQITGTAYGPTTVAFKPRPGQTSGGVTLPAFSRNADIASDGTGSIELTTGVEILVTLPDGYVGEIVVPDAVGSISLATLLATSTPPTNETLTVIADAIDEHNDDPEAHGGALSGTNLGNTPSPTGILVTSSTGDDTTLPLADGTNAGLMSPAHKTKLDNVAANAVAQTAVDASITAHNASTSAHSALTTFTGREVTSATDSLASTDDRKYVHYNRGAGVTVTLPNNLAVGATFEIVQTGDGPATFSAASGATLRHPDSHTKTRTKYSVVGLRVISNSGGSAAEYLLSGDTAA